MNIYIQFPVCQKPHYSAKERERMEAAEHEEEMQVYNDKRRYSLQCNLAQFKPQEIIVSVDEQCFICNSHFFYFIHVYTIQVHIVGDTEQPYVSIHAEHDKHLDSP